LARGGGEGRKSLPPPGSLTPATGRGAGAGHKARLRARGAWGVERGAAVRLVGAETRCAGRPHFTPGASARQVHRLQKVDADDGRVDAAEDVEVDRREDDGDVEGARSRAGAGAPAPSRSSVSASACVRCEHLNLCSAAAS